MAGSAGAVGLFLPISRAHALHGPDCRPRRRQAAIARRSSETGSQWRGTDGSVFAPASLQRQPLRWRAALRAISRRVCLRPTCTVRSLGRATTLPTRPLPRGVARKRSSATTYERPRRPLPHPPRLLLRPAMAAGTSRVANPTAGRSEPMASRSACKAPRCSGGRSSATI